MRRVVRGEGKAINRSIVDACISAIRNQISGIKMRADD